MSDEEDGAGAGYECVVVGDEPAPAAALAKGKGKAAPPTPEKTAAKSSPHPSDVGKGEETERGQKKPKTAPELRRAGMRCKRQLAARAL